MNELDKLRDNNKALRIGSVIPRFCFVCGSNLEVGLGWLQCEDEKCGEVFLPYIDKDNNQCLMHMGYNKTITT